MGHGHCLTLGWAGAWFVGQAHLEHLLAKLGAVLSTEARTRDTPMGGKLALAPFPCPFRRADGKSRGEGCGAREHFSASVPTLLMIWFCSPSGRSR